MSATGAASAGAARPHVFFGTTGSGTLDLVLEVGIILALVVLIILLIRNYRDRWR